MFNQSYADDVGLPTAVKVDFIDVDWRFLLLFVTVYSLQGSSLWVKAQRLAKCRAPTNILKRHLLTSNLHNTKLIPFSTFLPSEFVLKNSPYVIIPWTKVEPVISPFLLKGDSPGSPGFPYLWWKQRSYWLAIERPANQEPWYIMWRHHTTSGAMLKWWIFTAKIYIVFMLN